MVRVTILGVASHMNGPFEPVIIPNSWAYGRVTMISCGISTFPNVLEFDIETSHLIVLVTLEVERIQCVGDSKERYILHEELQREDQERLRIHHPRKGSCILRKLQLICASPP